MKRLVLCAALMAVAVVGCKKDAAKEAAKNAPAEGSKPGVNSDIAPPGPGAGLGDKAKNPEGCNSDFSQELAADYTLTEKCSPYTLGHDLNVDGFTLTIEPGVELRFKEGMALTVGYSTRAKLNAKGSTEKPIRFISETRKEPGAWKGIGIYASGSDSTLENVVIEHAGSEDHGALVLDTGGTTLKNVKVVASKGTALRMPSETPQKAISGLDFSKAGPDQPVADLEVRQVTTAFAADNVYAADAVLAVHGNSPTDVTFTKQGLAWRVLSDLNFDAPTGKSITVAVEPGTTLQLAEESGLYFGYSGEGSVSFKVKGTAERPVRFTRFGDDMKTTPAKGLGFYKASRAPEINFAVFEYLGRKDGAAITYNDARALGSITNSVFRNLAGRGILIDSARERFTAFSDNLFQSAAGAAIQTPLELAEGIASSNTFDKTWVELNSVTAHDVTLAALNAPYHVMSELRVEAEDAVKAATLTLQPGTSLAFGPQGSLALGFEHPGKLVAKGTPDKKISFSAISDDWGGLTAGDVGTLVIENAVISKVRDDVPGINTSEKTSGSVKNVSFESTKRGLKKCSTKLETAGLKADKTGKAEEPCT